MNIKSRTEVLWSWASLLVLIVCWDAALRLDRRVSERVHASERACSHRPPMHGPGALACDPSFEVQRVANQHGGAGLLGIADMGFLPAR